MYGETICGFIFFFCVHGMKMLTPYHILENISFKLIYNRYSTSVFVSALECQASAGGVGSSYVRTCVHTYVVCIICNAHARVMEAENSITLTICSYVNVFIGLWILCMLSAPVQLVTKHYTVVFLLQAAHTVLLYSPFGCVYQSTTPCPTNTEPISQGHCWKWHHKLFDLYLLDSCMTGYADIGGLKSCRDISHFFKD